MWTVLWDVWGDIGIYGRKKYETVERTLFYCTDKGMSVYECHDCYEESMKVTHKIDLKKSFLYCVGIYGRKKYETSEEQLFLLN